MAVRYRRKDGTWGNADVRREPSGWQFLLPADCGEIAEVVIMTGGGAAESGVIAHGNYGGGE